MLTEVLHVEYNPAWQKENSFQKVGKKGNQTSKSKTYPNH